MKTAVVGKIRTSLKAAALVLLFCLAAAEVASADETVDPPGRVARLSLAEGEVSLAPAGTEEWAEAVLNRPLTTGDKLWVESGARAELQVGAAVIHLDGNTGFSLIELDDDVLQMSVTEGTATVRVRRRAERETIQVETPNGTVSLLHPGEYTIQVDPERDETLVRTRSGDAEVLAGDDSHVVRKGEAMVFTGLERVEAQSRALGDRTAFEQWANDRERKQQEAESSRYVSNDVVGYEDLDEHGEWVREREYGYVWRPLYVSHDWAPYRYGRWVWIAPWGYTWIDDARWGFAPFHYGRWAHVQNRWCWVPGPRHLRPVYSPAFVAWTGGRHSHVGWFPLGPREAYLPGFRHSPRYVRLVNASNSHLINERDYRDFNSRRGNSRRGNSFDYRYARQPDAITVVDRDRFLAGRSLGGSRLHLSERDTAGWREQPRPPALTPYRESLLGGNTRPTPRGWTDADRNRQTFPRYQLPNRIPFEAERRGIEANGGRPLGRSQLIEPPKRGDDFRGESWQRQRREARTSGRVLSTAEAPVREVQSPRALHEMGTVRQPPEPGTSSWRSHRPNAAIDSVQRDREVRAREQVQDRVRQRDDNNNTRGRLETRSWNSGQGDAMRERVQRERAPARVPDSSPNTSQRIERSAPARVDTSRSARPGGDNRVGTMRSRER